MPGRAGSFGQLLPSDLGQAVGRKNTQINLHGVGREYREIRAVTVKAGAKLVGLSREEFEFLQGLTHMDW